MTIKFLNGVEYSLTAEELAEEKALEEAEDARLIAELPNNIRNKRNEILATDVDPLVSNPLRWVDISPDSRAAVTQYRLDLLAVPQQTGFPNNVVWPTQPEVL